MPSCKGLTALRPKASWSPFMSGNTRTLNLKGEAQFHACFPATVPTFIYRTSGAPNLIRAGRGPRLPRLRLETARSTPKLY